MGHSRSAPAAEARLKPTLVTGATGFLGKHLVSQLLASAPGAPLRVLNRGASAYDSDARVEVVRGDVTVTADVERAVNGCARVYHLAGWVSRNPADSARLHQIHVEGTRSVLASVVASAIAMAPLKADGCCSSSVRISNCG